MTAVQVPLKVTTSRLPVFFISHGGPNLMFEEDDGDLKTTITYLRALGRRITQEIKPRNVLVVSAHWQGNSTVEVNTAEKTKLLYDYYGFPSHYYEVQYENHGSPKLAERAMELLKKASIPVSSTTRGLDHGIFSPFKVMFPESNPLNVPIVQISLYPSDDMQKHIEVGQALAPLREEGTLIFTSGHAVHNLREMWTYLNKRPPSYVQEFTKDLSSYVCDKTGAERIATMSKTLKNHSLLRKAHPTLEHLLPLHVAVGAAGEDKGVEAFNFIMSSLAFGMFEFGVNAFPKVES